MSGLAIQRGFEDHSLNLNDPRQRIIASRSASDPLNQLPLRICAIIAIYAEEPGVYGFRKKSDIDGFRVDAEEKKSEPSRHWVWQYIPNVIGDETLSLMSRFCKHHIWGYTDDEQARTIDSQFHLAGEKSLQKLQYCRDPKPDPDAQLLTLTNLSYQVKDINHTDINTVVSMIINVPYNLFVDLVGNYSWPETRGNLLRQLCIRPLKRMAENEANTTEVAKKIAFLLLCGTDPRECGVVVINGKQTYTTPVTALAKVGGASHEAVSKFLADKGSSKQQS